MQHCRMSEILSPACAKRRWLCHLEAVALRQIRSKLGRLLHAKSRAKLDGCRHRWDSPQRRAVAMCHSGRWNALL